MSDSSNVGKILPNLKVTLGTEGNFQLEDEHILEDEESHLPSVSLTRKFNKYNWKLSSNAAREETNIYGGFETGLDLSTEETITRLNNRAKRFQLKEEETHQITAKEINELYKSLGIDPESLETSCRNVRLGVIHMRGVKEMNEKEVLDYFKDYGPWKVEWINDLSCNVLWNDNLSAARALLGVSQPMVVKKKSKNGSQIKGSSEICASSTETDKPTSAVSKENDTKWIFESTNEEYAVTRLEPQYENSAMEIDEETDNPVAEDDHKLEYKISIPPGNWRIGVSHPKASTILLRFANKDDKKIAGAEKRSQFYKKYGNPNYGGMKGYISESLKRKFQMRNTHDAVKKLSSTKDDPSHTSDIKRIRWRLNIPVDRMRMYADIEEEKKAGRSSHFQGSTSRESIKTRLGKRYSKDDLLKIGSQFSYKEDAPVEELSVECKIPSRFNIWTEQAKAMGEELEESESEDSLYEDEKQLDEEEEEEEEEEYSSRRDKRYCAYSSERYEIQKQYGYSGSSKDLRQTLNSSRRKKNAPRGDLRSRLSHLKKDDKIQKHRSPLLRDDF